MPLRLRPDEDEDEDEDEDGLSDQIGAGMHSPWSQISNWPHMTWQPPQFFWSTLKSVQYAVSHADMGGVQLMPVPPSGPPPPGRHSLFMQL